MKPRQSPLRRSGGGALTARAYPLPKRPSKRLRASPPPPVVLKAAAERWSTIQRDEVRYLFEKVDELIAALKAHKLTPRGYRTRTVYLSATGKGQRRLRRYEGTGPWYMEVKRRQGTMVTKRRRRFYGDVPGRRLTSTYWRTAYEWGRWRLTIDARIRFRRRSQSIEFPGFIVELKGKARYLKAATPPPAWLGGLLAGHQAPGFGKRKWAELMLAI